MAADVDGPTGAVGKLAWLSSIDWRYNIILVIIFNGLFKVARIHRARVGFGSAPQGLIEPGRESTALDNTWSWSRVLNLEARKDR